MKLWRNLERHQRDLHPPEELPDKQEPETAVPENEVGIFDDTLSVVYDGGHADTRYQ